MLGGHNVLELHSTLTVTRHWIHPEQNETLKAVKPTSPHRLTIKETDRHRSSFFHESSLTRSFTAPAEGQPVSSGPGTDPSKPPTFLSSSNGRGRNIGKTAPLVSPATNFKERHTARGPIRSGVFKGRDCYWPSKGKKNAPAADPRCSGGEASVSSGGKGTACQGAACWKQRKKTRNAY